MKMDMFNNFYVIADIGANHNGDIKLAKKLIRSAKQCGCNCVKFQSWTPDSLIAKEEYDRNVKYNDSPHKHFGSLREMVEKYYLRPEQHYELKKYCDQIEIDFASTPFSNEEVDLLIDLDVPFIKIASMDINNLSLLKYVAGKKKTIVMSTGMANLAEIERALDVLYDAGNKDVVLLHCISIYPPDDEIINLRNIVMLKQAFDLPIGFSDHTVGVSVPLAAIALGARIIEKHFTIDKTMPGWDHAISANPEEMKNLVNEGKRVIKALGQYRRVISGAELNKRDSFRRSAVAARDIKMSDSIQETDVCFKRPGTGIRPDELKYIVGRKAKKDIFADELIKWEDLV